MNEIKAVVRNAVNTLKNIARWTLNISWAHYLLLQLKSHHSFHPLIANHVHEWNVELRIMRKLRLLYVFICTSLRIYRFPLTCNNIANFGEITAFVAGCPFAATFCKSGIGSRKCVILVQHSEIDYFMRVASTYRPQNGWPFTMNFSRRPPNAVWKTRINITYHIRNIIFSIFVHFIHHRRP